MHTRTQDRSCRWAELAALKMRAPVNISVRSKRNIAADDHVATLPNGSKQDAHQHQARWQHAAEPSHASELQAQSCCGNNISVSALQLSGLSAKPPAGAIPISNAQVSMGAASAKSLSQHMSEAEAAAALQQMSANGPRPRQCTWQPAHMSAAACNVEPAVQGDSVPRRARTGGSAAAQAAVSAAQAASNEARQALMALADHQTQCNERLSKLEQVLGDAETLSACLAQVATMRKELCTGLPRMKELEKGLQAIAEKQCTQLKGIAKAEQEREQHVKAAEEQRRKDAHAAVTAMQGATAKAHSVVRQLSSSPAATINSQRPRSRSRSRSPSAHGAPDARGHARAPQHCSTTTASAQLEELRSELCRQSAATAMRKTQDQQPDRKRIATSAQTSTDSASHDSAAKCAGRALQVAPEAHHHRELSATTGRVRLSRVLHGSQLSPLEALRQLEKHVSAASSQHSGTACTGNATSAAQISTAAAQRSINAAVPRDDSSACASPTRPPSSCTNYASPAVERAAGEQASPARNIHNTPLNYTGAFASPVNGEAMPSTLPPRSAMPQHAGCSSDHQPAGYRESNTIDADNPELATEVTLDEMVTQSAQHYPDQECFSQATVCACVGRASSTLVTICVQNPVQSFTLV